MTNNVNSSKSRRNRSNGDGSVYPIRNRNSWGAAISNYLGERITKTFKTQEEAFAWLLEQKKLRAQGLFTEVAGSNQTDR